jgi:hypothetical protein
MQRKKEFSPTAVVSLILSIVVFASVIYGLHSAEAARGREAKRILEISLRRAAISCYAIEGMYPDTLEYLTDYYGVYVNESKYAVDYSIFASNIMPDITVIEK